MISLSIHRPDHAKVWKSEDNRTFTVELLDKDNREQVDIFVHSFEMAEQIAAIFNKTEIKPYFFRLPEKVREELLEWQAKTIHDEARGMESVDLATMILAGYSKEDIDGLINDMKTDKADQQPEHDLEVIEPEDQSQGDIEGVENESPQY